MRLIDVHTLEFATFLGERGIPDYAILSHTWGDGEVQYHHLLDHERSRQDGKLDFSKIDFVCEQAKRDSLKYAWVDTCCIDKTSSAELSEAINSMYYWYEKSRVCYVYMSDVEQLDLVSGDPKDGIGNVNMVLRPNDHLPTTGGFHLKVGDTRIEQEMLLSKPTGIQQSPEAMIDRKSLQDSTHGSCDALSSMSPPETSMPPDSIVSVNACIDQSIAPKTFQDSRWFTRGWTLQELLASGLLAFYDRKGRFLGTHIDLIHAIQMATEIPYDVLHRGFRKQWKDYSIAMRMSWASKRKTIRVEDEAYCLLGLFHVNMPLLYGEGSNAFIRQQEEIIKQWTDQSILAYKGDSRRVLAPSPSCFVDSANIYPADWAVKDKTFELTGRGLRANLRLWDTWVSDTHGEAQVQYALLDCLDSEAPGCYVGLPIVRQHREPNDDDAIDIVLDINHWPRYSGFARIPFNDVPRRGKDSMGDIPARAKRRAVFFLRYTPSQQLSEVPPIFVQVYLHGSIQEMACRLWPIEEWDDKAQSASLSTYPKIVILTHPSGTTFLLFMWTNRSSRYTNGGATERTLFHYRLVICRKPPSEKDLEHLASRSRGMAIDAYLHHPDKSETRYLRTSRNKRLAITIEPSPADSKSSIVSFREEHTAAWWFHGDQRLRIKQACYWISAPVWFPIFLTEHLRAKYKIRRERQRFVLENGEKYTQYPHALEFALERLQLGQLPSRHVLQDRTECLHDWVHR